MSRFSWHGFLTLGFSSNHEYFPGYLPNRRCEQDRASSIFLFGSLVEWIRRHPKDARAHKLPMVFTHKSVWILCCLSFLLLQAVSALPASSDASTVGTCKTTNMPVHEVLYFDGAGRAEITRILLHMGGVEFTDTRFKFPEWPDIKPTTPLGSVPVLKIDGKPHVQSTAMARYASKLAGRYPDDPVEALIVDEILETCNELMSKAPKSKDPEELKKLRQEFQATTMKKYASFIEKHIQNNGGTLCVGKQVTMADLAVSATVKGIQSGNWDHIDGNFFDEYAGILATAKAVDGDEKVKSYYASK